MSERELQFSLAINEGLAQMMKADPDVILIGQGVDSPWYVGQTTRDLKKRFGPDRVIDTPVSENGVTGIAVGAAIAGLKTVVVHPRQDFMLYAFDPIINEAANWSYMFNGVTGVPTVIWAIINRGGEQGPQHSQSLHAMFAHVPGLKVVMPSCASDAKGLMVAAIRDPNPVVFVDDRWLYSLSESVSEELYETPIGKANVIRSGSQLTIVANSWTTELARRALPELLAQGLDPELIDLRTVKPMDKETVVKSVKKTGKALVLDGGWRTAGLAAEVATVIHENCFSELDLPVQRITLPDTPAPVPSVLEKQYYIRVEQVVTAAEKMIESKGRFLFDLCG